LPKEKKLAVSTGSPGNTTYTAGDFYGTGFVAYPVGQTRKEAGICSVLLYPHTHLKPLPVSDGPKHRGHLHAELPLDLVEELEGA